MDMNKFMEKFIESKEMLEFLIEWYKNEPLRWCDIIAASRASIEDKAKALLEISKEFPPDEYWNPQKMADEAFAAIEETRKNPNGSVFMLSEYWRSDDWNKIYREYQTPFATFEQAHKEIIEYYKDYEDYPISDWCDIIRWDLDENGVLVEAVTWFLNLYGEIYGFDFEDNRKYDNDFKAIYGSDLNVRVPYQTGDIVLMDMSPFISPFPAVIAEAEREDITDCCHPQILYINEHGKIDGGALKHIPYHYPRFSPLLRLKRYDLPLEGQYTPIQIISDVIKKNPEKGRQLIDEVHRELDRIGKTRGLCWNYLKELGYDL